MDDGASVESAPLSPALATTTSIVPSDNRSETSTLVSLPSRKRPLDDDDDDGARSSYKTARLSCRCVRVSKVDVTEAELRESFEQFGVIVDIKLAHGNAVITFDSDDAAATCIKEMGGQEDLLTVDHQH